MSFDEGCSAYWCDTCAEAGSSVEMVINYQLSTEDCCVLHCPHCGYARTFWAEADEQEEAKGPTDV